ncbi:hypothetical protein STAFG_6479 [Streptomyces afghaniensis 772]|uniref:HTH cro/C1-type domain-containing protein n=1 Tax=Streptomyces afghaniensis 772 TaxID=1283301 RepID=S4MS84_9ACTN|nr:hypothetical protein STAFG_6479 [Streptomyces afghaniensis 772]
MSELFDAVDALVASRSPLPPPAERKRLRQAHGLTLDEVAAALQVRRATVSGWEAGKTEPRPPERDAYARMLKQLAQLYPATHAAVPPKDTSVPETSAAPAAPAPPAAARPRPAQDPQTRPRKLLPGTPHLTPSAPPVLPLCRARRHRRPGRRRRRADPPPGRRLRRTPRRPTPTHGSRTAPCSSSTPTTAPR